MQRRIKIITAFFFFTFYNPILSMSQISMPLYQDGIPNSKPAPDSELPISRGSIVVLGKVSVPTLSVYLPAKEKATGTAVIICPGGGYSVITIDHEGKEVAKKFTEMGVAAFVLKYRIPDTATMIDKTIGPLQDLQQAIKLVREGAEKWHVKTNQVGILGFSAGGHLAATAGTHFDKAVIDNPNNTSLRPDFLLLIYPVISFADSIAHMGSRDQLIGVNPSVEKIKTFSNELQVTNKTPTTFLLHASDDEAVKVENSLLFYLALLKHQVPAELHIYETGGHGFGLHLKNKNEAWIERAKNWMENHGWLNR